MKQTARGARSGAAGAGEITKQVKIRKKMVRAASWLHGLFFFMHKIQIPKNREMGKLEILKSFYVFRETLYKRGITQYNNCKAAIILN